jgi:hypothetical protein
MFDDEDAFANFGNNTIFGCGSLECSGMIDGNRELAKYRPGPF